MVEVNFKDRVPTHPGRIKLTPVQGQENTFDMERADEPVEIGTPLDKATFESIIQSRLTGRYYLPVVNQKEISNITTDINIIPTSGWINADRTSATQNGYELFSSPASEQSGSITAAFDRDDSSFWIGRSQSEDTYIGFKFPNAITVGKIKTKVSFNDEKSYHCIIQASNNGTTWTNVSAQTAIGENASEVEVEITNASQYLYYRIKFVGVPTGYSIFCYSIETTKATVITKQNEFVIDEFPLTITDHQRFTITTPPTVNTIGVTENTLNGRNIDVILQPNKRYELVSSWNGNYYAREM